MKPFTGLRLMGSFLLSHHLSHFLRTPIPSLSLPYHCIACCCWCCCCQVASVVSDSVRPHRHQPTRFCRPWYFPGKSTGVGCHCLLQCVKVKSESEVTQLCLTLSDPMDCSPPGSSVRGIFQERVLEWGAIAFSRIACWEWSFPCQGPAPVDPGLFEGGDGVGILGNNLFNYR